MRANSVVGVKPAFPRGLDLRRLDADDVRPAVVQRVDFPLVNVEAGDGELLAGEEQDQRQADVAETDHADAGAAGINPGQESVRGSYCGNADGHRSSGGNSWTL